jgi:hypothetical protein
MRRTPRKTAIRFVRNKQEMEQVLQTLKQTRCAHCGRVGTLNRHDTLHGNDLAAADKQTERGRRAWCSNRGRRGGCGRTMAVVFVRVLPRHSLTAPLLDKLLGSLRAGRPVQAAWEHSRLPVPVQTAYHLLQRLRGRLPALRSALCSRCAPPASRHSDPLRQTAEHLRRAFAHARHPVEAFQYAFQCPLMG